MFTLYMPCQCQKMHFIGKTATLRFRAPFGDLEPTYDVHLRLIGKRVVDFRLVIIELFFAIGVTAEAL